LKKVANSAVVATPKQTFKIGLKIASGLRKFRITGIERNVLQNAGTISANLAKAHAESEFEKYRVVQDQRFESAFDKEVKNITAPKATDVPLKKIGKKGAKDAS
jgi:hypothetical protein